MRSPQVARFAAGWIATVLVATVVLMGAAVPASAHPYFLTSTPSPDAVLQSSPAEIDITYTEALDYPYSKVALVGPDQRVITTHQVPASGPSTLAVVPNRPLTTPGTYAVGWTAVGQDGHTVTGSFAISIGHPSAQAQVTDTVAGVAGSASGQGAVVETLLTLLPVFTVVLAGLLLLVSVVAGATAGSSAPAPASSAREVPAPEAAAAESAAPEAPGPESAARESAAPESAAPEAPAPEAVVDADREAVGRRVVWLFRVAWSGLFVVVAGLSVHAVTHGGISAFVASSSGRRLLAQLILVGLAGPIALARRGLQAGDKPDPLRWLWGAVVALGLLIALAVSGHAESQPDSRRLLVIGVYSVHLIAVAVWAAALAAVLLPATRRRPFEPLARLRPLVSVAIVAVVVTGVADTAWGIRSIAQVGETAYGRVVAAKFVLYVATIALGMVATAGFAHVRSRTRRRLMLGEVAIGTVILLLAGVLSQLPQPIDVPFSSQLFAARAGIPISVGASGGDLVVGTLSPGLVGMNRVMVQVDSSDSNDFLVPVPGVQSMSVRATCGCGHDLGLVDLRPVSGSSWWVANLDLAAPATWSLEATVGYQTGAGPTQPAKGSPLEQAQLTAQILPTKLPDQVIIGVPADLSGSYGSQCQDQALGLQVALDDVNSRAQDHGHLVRVLTVDTHDGVGPAMDWLRSVHPTAIALPCGDPAQVAAAIAQAQAWAIPVVSDQPALTTTGKGVWSVAPDWASEGKLLADQAHTQGAQSVAVLAGSTAVDRQELAATTTELTRLGVVYGVSSIPSDPARFAGNLEAVDPDALIIIANPDEALPTVQALSAAELSDPWRPARGVLASSQLMDTDFINAAGQATRLGVIEFASDIDPFDPIDQYYAQRLRTLIPGVRPTFDGVHGYIAGLVLATALSEGGGAPSTSRLTKIFGSRFSSFGVGSYSGSWDRAGGNADQLAFFRSTYINPLAMPANSPGGVTSMDHEGTFLDSGGFEQVAPFVKVGT